METKTQIEKRTRIKFCEKCDNKNLVYCSRCAMILINRLDKFLPTGCISLNELDTKENEQ